MFSLTQVGQYLPVFYATFMGGMGALATTLGVVDVVFSMMDRVREGGRRRKERDYALEVSIKRGRQTLQYITNGYSCRLVLYHHRGEGKHRKRASDLSCQGLSDALTPATPLEKEAC